MKFKHIHIQNGIELIPSWSLEPISILRAIDGVLEKYTSKFGDLPSFEKQLPFSVEITIQSGDYQILLIDQANSPPWPGSAKGLLVIESVSPCGGSCVINLPFNPILRGYPSTKGRHCVYQHLIKTETPLVYIGVTKNRWFDRLNQHWQEARRGSVYLFHTALRQHLNVSKGHVVMLVDLDQDCAMNLEEELVELTSLYPLGLNMIPGGYAGIKYLSRLGFNATTPKERDDAVLEISSHETWDGKANPLCAARWASDQDFINRVICGHRGRLTLEQVRAIRLLGFYGISSQEIALRVTDSPKRVQRVLCGMRYGRVK